MNKHLTGGVLEAFFRGSARGANLNAISAHLSRCRSCWARAVAVQDRIPPGEAAPSPLAAAIVRVMRAEEAYDDELFRARASLQGLLKQSPKEQKRSLAAAASLQSLLFFEVLVDEVKSRWTADPAAAESLARLAADLAEHLKRSRFPPAMRADLKAEAMIYVANCRRIAADFRGSRAALDEARDLLAQGTGEPKYKAMLLSFAAAHATDTGKFESALDFLERALILHRQEGDLEAEAFSATQRAGILMTAGRFTEAILSAESVLGIPLLHRRLELMAKCILVESLVGLRRVKEARVRLADAQTLASDFPEAAPRFAYLEALILAAQGHARESEKRMHEVAVAFLDMDRPRDALLAYLTLFDFLYRRKAYLKAVELCTEVLRQPEILTRPDLRAAWEELIDLAQRRALEEAQLPQIQRFFIRHWAAPAKEGLTGFLRPAGVAPAPGTWETEMIAMIESPQEKILEAPSEPDQVLLGQDFRDALDRHEGVLFRRVFLHCNQSIRKTAMALHMSRNTVKAKMEKFGLRGVD